ncbi:MAG: hypothetical protein LBL23_01575 [Coriobacteriales bacterium]|jgi:hypothetical protein|nr:hypothetical protein [Coriobacteriales bacterium]
MQNPTPYTSPYELVARIGKTRGLEGQLVAQELGELPVLCPGLELWIVPPALEGVRHSFVTEAQDDFKKHGVLIRLEGVDDRTQASRLTGRYLLAWREQVERAVRHNSLAGSGASTEDFGGGRSGGSHGTSGGEAARQADEASVNGAQARLAQQTTTPLGTAFIDTAYGSLGSLDTIKAGPAYAIWVLAGPYGRLEIPAVDAYVVEEAPGQITLSLPRGFVEITTGTGTLHGETPESLPTLPDGDPLAD